MSVHPHWPPLFFPAPGQLLPTMRKALSGSSLAKVMGGAPGVIGLGARTGSRPGLHGAPIHGSSDERSALSAGHVGIDAAAKAFTTSGHPRSPAAWTCTVAGYPLAHKSEWMSTCQRVSCTTCGLKVQVTQPQWL